MTAITDVIFFLFRFTLNKFQLWIYIDSRITEIKISCSARIQTKMGSAQLIFIAGKFLRWGNILGNFYLISNTLFLFCILLAELVELAECI